MAIVQTIEVTETTTFHEWISSLSGDELVAAQAAVADRDQKWEQQVAIGNVYINKNGQRVWVSEEAEQAHMDNVVKAYADLIDQWQEETGSSLTVSVEPAESADTILSLVDWAFDNLSDDDYIAWQQQGPLAQAEVDALIDSGAVSRNADDSHTFANSADFDALQSAYPIAVSTKLAYLAYVAEF